VDLLVGDHHLRAGEERSCESKSGVGRYCGLYPKGAKRTKNENGNETISNHVRPTLRTPNASRIFPNRNFQSTVQTTRSYPTYLPNYRKASFAGFKRKGDAPEKRLRAGVHTQPAAPSIPRCVYIHVKSLRVVSNLLSSVKYPTDSTYVDIPTGRAKFIVFSKYIYRTSTYLNILPGPRKRCASTKTNTGRGR